jgi:hypothetical protein
MSRMSSGGTMISDRSNNVPLSNDSAVHNFGLDCSYIFHSPLTDPARWTAG